MRAVPRMRSAAATLAAALLVLFAVAAGSAGAAQWVGLGDS
jgi:hypothetical protein